MKTLREREDKDILTSAGFLVKSRLIDECKLPLFLTVAGSHSYGLERPDSDIDIRGIYLDPTEKILSLHPGRDTIEGFIGDEQRIDYQLYEFGKFLGMLLKGNGNMIRMILSPLTLYYWPDIDWVRITKKFITRKLCLYYTGYAASQRKRAMSERGGKALIYTYREIFEGFSVMVTGQPIFDFRKLWQWVTDNKFYKGGLLDRYFEDPTQEVTDEGWRQFYQEWEVLSARLGEVADKSFLPESYDGYAELNHLLYYWRIKGLFLPALSIQKEVSSG